jgi:deazaflavin-dependent oxidoreductase (nitroreductase family)
MPRSTGDAKRRTVMAFQKYALNPVTRLVAGTIPGWVLLETTGRRSGKPRRIPLGGTRDGDTFWVVSEHGRKANYVRNIAADPRVRLKIGGRWRTGRATIVPDDDAQARVRTQSRWNSNAVRLFGTDLLSVRIDLDPA